ncbi:hypothetical protein JW851_03190 [Candidatus Woesearchaeota archaeon]|nr:hypothetical protein [Candidatus Woesearchaeota archaeon]
MEANLMISKNKIKNMFLLQLEQNSKPNSGVSHGADSIIKSMNKGKLTNDERDLAWEGFEELKIEGLIIPDPSQMHSPMFTKLTTKGKTYVESLKSTGDLNFESFNVDFSKLISDNRLKDACQSDLDSGEEKKYWDGVNNAMRHLEVRVREKANLPNDTVGVDVMSKAFNFKNGKLILTCSNTQEEKEGFLLVLMGLIKFHRNLKAHNEGKLSRSDSLKIVAYVDYILGIIKLATRERTSMDEFI